MLATRGFLVFLILVFITISNCEADHRLPAPTGLSSQWLDQFTLQVSWSWSRPENLPQDCNITYNVDELGPEGKRLRIVRVTSLTLKEKYLMQPKSSNQWEISIKALPRSPQCSGWIDSEPSNLKISAKKSYAELVKDFKCVVQPKNLKCSWIPADPSQNLTISYRHCGKSAEIIESLQRCDHIDDRGDRRECVLKLGDLHDTCVVVETEDKMNTFEPKLVINLPKLNIKEDQDYFHFKGDRPKVGDKCIWEYNIWYKECNDEKIMNMPAPTTPTNWSIPYNKCCKYEFQYNVTAKHICPEMSSDNSNIIVYEAKMSCISTVTVIAIALPVLLFISVMLSFYCFRRHRSIICPKIPEPANFFKELMHGNSATKAAPVSLYTPVPEPVESINTLVPKRSNLSENS